MSNNFQTSAHGLSKRSFSILASLLAQHPEIEAAKLYGSRARGDYRHGSDIDVALYGDVSHSTLSKLFEAHYFSELVHFVDFTPVKEIGSPDLKAAIERDGIEIYRRDLTLTGND